MPTTAPMPDLPNPTDSKHPKRAMLEDFVNGRIDDTASREIEQHIESCAECCEELARLSAESDEFVQLVADAKARQPAPVQSGETPSANDTSAEPGSDHTELTPLAPARRVGRFEILGHRGEGGFGLILLAYDPRLRREVAVKVPRLGSLLSPALRERFLREARAAGALDHPNIVPIHEAGEADNLCYIASAYCRGPNLAVWLKQRNEPVPFRMAAWLVAELAAGVDHAHRRGVLHRDLKPSNVLLEPLGEGRSADEAGDFGFQPRISDFGLARLQNEDGDATASHAVLGTANYMAPEQALGRSHFVGQAADVYALGAILYELLTGRAPFAGDSELDTLQRVPIEDPVPPVRLRPRTPRDLETICLKCLEKEPGRRYASAGELAADLRAFLAGKPIRARAIGWTGKSARWCRRNPVVATLTGGLVGALVLIAVGSIIMSVRFNRQFHRAVDAEQAGKQHLWDSYLAGVRANRVSKVAGQRFTSLEVLRKAVPLAAELNLGESATLTMRNEAIACLLLADLQLESQWHAVVSDVRASRVSFDGELTRYALASDSACIVRRVGTSADERRLPVPPGTVERLELSRDGRFLAAMANIQDDDDSRVYLWDLSSPATVPRALDVPQAAGFCFDVAATMVGIVEKSGKISILDLANGSVSASGAASLTAVGCSFDHAGNRLAVWGGSSVEVVDVRKRSVIRRLSFPGDDQILCANFSPDGRWLAAGGSHHVVYLWHEQQPAPKFVLQGHQAWVTGVNFTPDGSLLASSSTDGTTRLWRSWTGAELVVGRGYGLRFSQDGKRLAGLLGVGMAIYRVAGEAARRTFRSSPSHSYEAVAVEISPDGALLAASNSNGVDLWRIDSGSQLASLHLPTLPWAQFLARENEQLLLTGSEQGVQARTVALNQTSGHLSIGEPRSIAAADEVRPAYDGALSDDGRTLILINGKGAGRIVDLTGSREPVAVEHTQFQHGATSAEGKWLATYASGSLGIELWSTETGKHVESLSTEYPVLVAAFSPDDKWLAVDTASELLFFNIGSWSINHRHVWDDGQSTLARNGGLSFTQDGNQLAVHRRNYEFQLIHPATGKLLATLPTEAPNPNLGFSPNGRRLAAIGPNLTIQLWDLSLIHNQLKELGLDWR